MHRGKAALSLLYGGGLSVLACDLPRICDHRAELLVICYILRYNKPTELPLTRGL